LPLLPNTNSLCIFFLSSIPFSLPYQGGQLGLAWQYFQQHGSVTETCLPYGDWEKPIAGPIPTCPADKQPCMPPTFVQTPPPQTACAQGSEVKSFTADKSFVSNIYNVGSARDMQREIMANGPIEGQFSVYSDFPTYKSGVYQQSYVFCHRSIPQLLLSSVYSSFCTHLLLYTHPGILRETHRPNATMLGGHAIKIIGWGVEAGTPYWLVQNSWTTTWGDGGYFKM
jgi:cathepsin B